jgi:hypothetical protein
LRVVAHRRARTHQVLAGVDADDLTRVETRSDYVVRADIARTTSAAALLAELSHAAGRAAGAAVLRIARQIRAGQRTFAQPLGADALLVTAAKNGKHNDNKDTTNEE